MQLRVLGCHGPYPCAGGATSGYLLETEKGNVLMDCGAGIMGKLMACMDPADLKGILLSHLHFDHASDMLVLKYYLEKQGRKLPVFIPGEDRSPLRDMLNCPVFEVQPYPEKLEIAALTVTVFPVRHPVPCRAIRLTEGEKALTFTGDTNDCPGLSGFAKNSDVLLADSAFLTEEWTEKKPHMSAAGAAKLAAEAGAKRLYLTHLPIEHAPETLEKEARAVYPEAKAVYPGMVISL